MPRFIKVIHGGEGCGKSTATKITKHIVDPTGGYAHRAEYQG